MSRVNMRRVWCKYASSALKHMRPLACDGLPHNKRKVEQKDDASDLTSITHHIIILSAQLYAVGCRIGCVCDNDMSWAKNTACISSSGQ